MEVQNKVWLVKLVWAGYDTNDAHIVVASSKENAIKLALAEEGINTTRKVDYAHEIVLDSEYVAYSDFHPG